jgi:hypothetical protein
MTSQVIAGGGGAAQAGAMLNRLAWLLLAALHVPSALALVRPSLIEALYGVTRDMAVFPLVQHRAALFAAVVAICLWAMADSRVRRLASVACAISMLSFLLLWWLAGAPPALGTIALADLLFLPVLAYAGWRAFRT